MGRWFKRFLGAVALAVVAALGRAAAQDEMPPSSRVALVVGESSYGADPLPSAANDAGLVAQTLAAAGFSVIGARDLDGEGLRRAFRDLLDAASRTGPNGVALVYLAGHAVQFDGDNYFVPVGAKIPRGADLPIAAVRVSDLTRALATLPLRASVAVVDGAYADSRDGTPYAAGLALAEPEPGLLLAFNAAPGTTSPSGNRPYGIYAENLVQLMKQGGVPIGEMFDRLRVAVNTATGGAVLPWSASKLGQSFAFFERAPGAPLIGSAQVPFATLRTRPLRDFSPEQAYDVAIARDSIASYTDYLEAFPDAAQARRVRAFLALRREAATWRAAVLRGAAPAFWTYLQRYPSGPHAADARRRLTRLAAAAGPPRGFAPLAFEVPPPQDSEFEFLRGPLRFEGAGFEPPPPPPVFLLPPPSREPEVLRSPEAAPGPGLLPMPIPGEIPYVRPIVRPGTIAPPRGAKGTYPRRHPFAATPAGEAIVVEPAPASDNGAARPGIAPKGSGPASPDPNPVAPVPAAPRPPPAAASGSAVPRPGGSGAVGGAAIQGAPPSPLGAPSVKGPPPVPNASPQGNAAAQPKPGSGRPEIGKPGQPSELKKPPPSTGGVGNVPPRPKPAPAPGRTAPASRKAPAPGSPEAPVTPPPSAPAIVTPARPDAATLSPQKPARTRAPEVTTPDNRAVPSVIKPETRARPVPQPNAGSSNGSQHPQPQRPPPPATMQPGSGASPGAAGHGRPGEGNRRQDCGRPGRPPCRP